MRLPITPEDLPVITELKNAGVLNITNHHSNSTRRILVGCSDGFQIRDLVNHHSTLIHNGSCLDEPCCHSHLQNGGAFILSDELTEDYAHRASLFILEQLPDSLRMKKATTVDLCIHARCGLATDWKLSIEETIYHLFCGASRTKRFLAEQNLHPDILLFIQVDYGMKRRSYRLCRKAWKKWHKEKNNAFEFALA